MKKTKSGSCKTEKNLESQECRKNIPFLLDKSNLRLTEEKERGTYILKPKPHGLKKVLMAPANEHLTMQIASPIYRIPTAVTDWFFSATMNRHT